MKEKTFIVEKEQWCKTLYIVKAKTERQAEALFATGAGNLYRENNDEPNITVYTKKEALDQELIDHDPD